jgi:preprotein translocase subunit SecE
MAGMVNNVKESFEELKSNVTWTPWAEAQRLTIVVAVFSIIFSIAIWGVDTFFAKILGYIYNLVLGTV